MKTVCLILLLATVFVNHSDQAPNGQVKVSLYYEALCPGCMQFITQQLYPGYKKIGSSLLLDLTPYGNARRQQVNGTWVFECQHGPSECAINKIVACGQARTQNQDKLMEYVYCVEMHSQSGKTDLKKIAECASVLGLSANTILQCAQGSEGNELLAKLADKQAALQPPIEYVPWIILNDGPHDENTQWDVQLNFLKTICSLLSDKPAGCVEFNKIPSDY